MNLQPSSRWVVIRAPAKLNLFLELIAKRPDGYHDIDTVMVPINRYDTLRICVADHDEVRIATHWWPSRDWWVQTLGEPQASSLLDIPGDDRNLIHRAITATVKTFGIRGGFDVEVRKRIPAGAGMGGASSDAAAAIRAVAEIYGLPANDLRFWQIAAQIGSDVPFFLGAPPIPNQPHLPLARAMRATGRGEVLSCVGLNRSLRLLVVYPATSLSTAKVYGQCVVPERPSAADAMIEAMQIGETAKIGEQMRNRLAEPALNISPMVRDLLEQMWRCGLPRCQLTGSGSACFSLLDDSCDSNSLIGRLRKSLHSLSIPAHIFRAETIAVPQRLLAGR